MSFVRGAVSRISSSTFLPLRRHYSVRSSSALSSFSAPRGFEWRKLVSPHTSPEAIEAFKSIESSVAKLSNEVASTPAAPAAIDWNKWTKSIKTPGAVAELKKQYEATLSSISSAETASTAKKPVEIEEFNAEFDKIISKAESIAKVSQEEANKLKESLQFLENIELAIAHGNLSEPAAALLTNPGLKERLLEEYENGEFAPTEAELRVYNMDVNAIRNVIVNGGDIDVGGLVPADRFGEFKPTAIPQEVKEWEKKIYGDLAKGDDAVNWEFETDPYADEKSDDHH